MAARYELRRAGVWDRNEQRLITRADAVAWAQYLAAWHAGDEIDPIPPRVDDPLSPEEIAARQELADRTAMRAALKMDNTIQFLRTHTPAECEAWVQSNVTDLATAKNVLGKLAMIVAYLARERLANRE